LERHFEYELTQLKQKLIAMGTIVDHQLSGACRALFQSNVQLAQTVIAGDKQVDELDITIDRDCQRIFALSQPVAIDLRLLMSALKMNAQLERIGDIAVNIAERTEPLIEFNNFLLGTRLSEMAQIARIMVKDALDSFVEGNAGIATRVLESDDVVDRLDRQIFQQMVREMESDHTLIVPASHILILSRHIERMADHATNIAEDVIFLLEARLVKHHAEEVEQQRGTRSVI
jgi:phosphate transport system protein